MTLYDARIEEEKKVNKEVGFWERKTVWSFIQEYTARLKALKP